MGGASEHLSSAVLFPRACVFALYSEVSAHWQCRLNELPRAVQFAHDETSLFFESLNIVVFRACECFEQMLAMW